MAPAWVSDVPKMYPEVMFGGSEWIIVVVVALVLFGGTQIPKLARSLGQAQTEFKKGISESDSDSEDADSEESGEKAEGSEKKDKKKSS